MKLVVLFASLTCAVIAAGCATGAPPACGDGRLDPEIGEVCDDGNAAGGDGCSADCASREVCGNRIVDTDAGEACDDGNQLSGDGCDATCVSDESCGNGVLDVGSGEACDDGNGVSGDGCSGACASERCGNLTVDLGEACDDGNELDGDGCSANCRSDESCGNGILDGAAGEVCDDDNAAGGDGCSADCLSDETCGNGTTDGAVGEVCDDGNAASGDGCSADCLTLENTFLWMVRETDNMLRVLDTTTLAFTDIAPLTQPFEFGELAFDNTTQTMWMIDGRGSQSLHRVNIGTGVVTTVGSHGIVDLFGLTYDPTTGRLYGSGESPTGFYEMNTTTGTATFIGDPGRAADGLAYDTRRNQIVALAAGPGDMHIIDPATGLSTVVSNNGFVNNCGLAYDAFNDVLWAIDWSGNLYTFDPNNNYARTGPILSGLGPHDGLTPGPSPLLPPD